jgi:acetylornithine deacetylase
MSRPDWGVWGFHPQVWWQIARTVSSCSTRLYDLRTTTCVATHAAWPDASFLMAQDHTLDTTHAAARALMELMVATSQRPGGGNLAFVEAMQTCLRGTRVSVSTVTDPDFPDRALLAVDTGEPSGDQSLVAISHCDVVGVDSQVWHTDPWTLHEEAGIWVGRGVCDTHGSGVAMLLAAGRPDVQRVLRHAKRRVTIVFTYDEEATAPALSMRGARLAIGDLGPASVITAKHFVAGEPTEFNQRIVPMRAHKGRWLAHFTVSVDRAGHVADLVQNAFMLGADVVQQIGSYAHTLRYGHTGDPTRAIYHPPHSTVQVSAVDVKHGDYSVTPAQARFTVDMRTLPDRHGELVSEMTDLITNSLHQPDVRLDLEVVKDAEGSTTCATSPIVRAAEEATGYAAQGFNGGDEGRVLRRTGGMDGVTLGPGDLRIAHTANEYVTIDSVMAAVDIYADLFRYSARLGL